MNLRVLWLLPGLLVAAGAARALRFTAGWETTRQDWTALLSALKSIQSQIGRPEKKLARQAKLG